MNPVLVLPPLPILQHNFTECPAKEDEDEAAEASREEEFDDEDDTSGADQDSQRGGLSEEDEVQMKPLLAAGGGGKEKTPPPPPGGSSLAASLTQSTTVGDLTKSLIHFISSRKHQQPPLWQYEDITSKVWRIRSAEQLDVFLQHVLRAFELSLPPPPPAARLLSERWAELALQLALNCSSRHYAGRSLQIFR